MNTIIKVTAYLSVIFFWGCERMLDIKPKGQIILTSADEYASLLDNPFDLNFSTVLTWSTCFDAGNSISLVVGKGDLFTKANYLGLEDVDRSSYLGTEWLYRSCYTRISRYNIIIDNIMDAKGSEADRKRTLAEAKILRAYNYFLLINTFSKHFNPSTAEKDGGVLVRDRFSLEMEPIQQSVAQVYRFIESDINSALPNLEPKGKNVNHPGLAFAYAFKAKVHLFKQEFAQAEEAAKKSLQHNSYLFDWVAWDTSTKPVPEIGYNNEENLYFGYGTSNSPVGNSIGPRLVQKYTAGDLRKERFFWYNNVYILPGNYTFREYRDPGTFYTRTIKFNINGMKVSETMLMLAECYVRSGKIADGLKILNDIRKKRILPESYQDLTANTKEEAFAQVMDERSRELVLTPNNFYDIRRLEAEGIRQSVDRVLPNGQIYTVRSNSPVFVMPFPRDAIEQSGTLKQNVAK